MSRVVVGRKRSGRHSSWAASVGGRPARRASAAACAFAGACAVLLGAGAAPAAAAGTPFTPARPAVFIAQGNSTALEQAVESNGQLAFKSVGPPAGFHYNAMAYDTINNYLYAVILSGPGARDIIQIDSSGHPTDTGVNVGPGGRHEDVGAFDTANGELYFGSSDPGARTLFVYNPATGARSTLPLSAAPLAADLAYAQGYLWGIGHSGIVRVDPTTGTVTAFTIPPGLLPGMPNTSFGAAWTYGNGNLGFSNNTSGTMYQVQVAGASTASPSFTLVSSQPGPANSINDGASIPGQPVDLALTKSASPTSVASGGQITYTLTVTNDGPGNSSGYVVDDPLPTGLVNPQTTTPGCSIAAGTLTCQGNPLAVGASATITVTGTAPAPNPTALTNTATVTGNEQDPNLANNTASATVQPLPGADLALVKTAAPTSVTAGGQVTYTLLVTNNGPDDASGVTVTDPLPAGETLVSATPSQGSCSGTSCQLGTIADGGQAQILVTVDVSTSVSGTVTNTASVAASTPDPNQANNTSSATVTVAADSPGSPDGPPGAPRTTNGQSDLSIVKRVNHAAARPGQLLTYTLVITNHGPDAASGVTVMDSPKLAVSDVHATPSQGSCTTGKVVRCSLGTIADGASATITVTERVTKPGMQDNSASVTSSGSDPKTSNNLGHAKTRVAAPAPRLSLRKTASPARIRAGGSVTYRITVSASRATAKNLRVCDALPLGLTFTSATPRAGLSNGRECWTIRSLRTGHSRTLVLRARALAGAHGTLVNHATATAPGTKTARASATVKVTPAPKPPPTPVTG
ncbi:MAG TPA: DUF11 domain-containing protein [Solirubrobacteraceae bacterium]|nr:DUF11 domain-containing protein [Solirubrobacteraceae bacterium]